MNKHEVAALLEEIGVLLDLKGENPFKVRAYHNAARAIENLDEDIKNVVHEGRLQEVPGIGEKIADKVSTLIKTGSLPYYEELKSSLPKGLFELLELPGLGPKKIKALYDQLKITNIEELAEACKTGKVAKLAHFSEKSQDNFLKNISGFKSKETKRKLFWKINEIAEKLCRLLYEATEAKIVEIAGSLRRKLETIGDIDLLVSTENAKKVLSAFTSLPEIEKILAKGETKATVILKSGIQVDLRVVKPHEFAFAWIYFTGSKQHNIKLRERAHKMGYRMSEYGLEPLSSNIPPLFSVHSKKVPRESDVYKSLGLSYIPPELREDMGEIEAAAKGALPKLIKESDIKGVFHCHTTASDGHNTLEEMVKAAESYRWEYFGIADHSKSSFQANGLNEERLLEQIEEIRKLNASKKFSLHVFSGSECDILTDGTLDFSDDILKKLDYVIASVHRSFQLDEKAQTARIIKAIENPYTTMIGHVTGRLLLKRKPYALDLSKIVDACIANGKILELNAQPLRLDLDWRFWHKASEKGLKTCINPDAHRIEDLSYVRGGVYIAQKGWLTKDDVLNTLPLKTISGYLKKRQKR